MTAKKFKIEIISKNIKIHIHVIFFYYITFIKIITIFFWCLAKLAWLLSKLFRLISKKIFIYGLKVNKKKLLIEILSDLYTIS